MSNAPTQSASYYKFPVVLTPAAWLESVHVEEPRHDSESTSRLAEVVMAAYRELHLQPDAEQINFGLYRFPPKGDRFERVWLDLTLRLVVATPGMIYLHIALKDEKSEFWL
ncbi:hypothetical protein [Pseudomonas sp. MWU12-2345]|uniref:hypothetical protein n=1 Tax=Pseudomonas sp. MWU12-2345 TaxID=2928689 RepID=UPI00200D4500|nr:hypothetical protein [Pseudomonas sp. MWU12-2345]